MVSRNTNNIGKTGGWCFMRNNFAGSCTNKHPSPIKGMESNQFSNNEFFMEWVWNWGLMRYCDNEKLGGQYFSNIFTAQKWCWNDKFEKFLTIETGLKMIDLKWIGLRNFQQSRNETLKGTSHLLSIPFQAKTFTIKLRGSWTWPRNWESWLLAFKPLPALSTTPPWDQPDFRPL